MCVIHGNQQAQTDVSGANRNSLLMNLFANEETTLSGP